MKSIFYSKIKFSLLFIGLSLLTFFIAYQILFSKDFFYGLGHIENCFLAIIIIMFCALGCFLFIAYKQKILALKKGVLISFVFTLFISFLHLRYIAELL